MKSHKGSGNVFADIGLAHPEKVLARAKIMFAVAEILKKRGLTQNQAAEILGIPQSKVSCLMHGKLSMFSMDHLFQFLNALDNNVNIVINEKTKGEKAFTHVVRN
jgi:predicted XRE-type DNA-binding protein